MKAADLDLIGPALAAALEIEAAFPEVVFTSGRRRAEDQARAMAANVHANRHWIAQTYKPTASSAELQAWVSQNLKFEQTAASIEAGLLAIMVTWTDDQKHALSRHFSGEAFDVQPTDDANLHAYLAAYPGMKFLDREGGLVRWHMQTT